MLKKIILMSFCIMPVLATENFDKTLPEIKTKVSKISQEESKNLKNQLQQRIDKCQELTKKINEFVEASKGWATWEDYFNGLDSVSDSLIQFRNFSGISTEILSLIDQLVFDEAICQREALKKETNILDKEDNDYRDKIRFIRNLSTLKFYSTLKESYIKILSII